MKTFMEKCVDGEASVEEVDEYVEYWHTHEIDMPLHEYLGLSPSEYALWRREGNGYLGQFLEVRKTGKIPFVFNS
ncbi:hypothetical protein [Dorea sp.]|uniref:hypothetical protein n=1 Tax=Dorea sp. TaxID=2040332 RepID=UPI0035276165